jgi:hypothetical protein
MMRSFLVWLESKLPKTTITINGKPYLTRCYLFGKDRAWGNIYLHHFHSSDQGDELHNHPWAWGLSFVLAGGYVEERASNPWTWEAHDPNKPYNPLEIDDGWCCGQKPCPVHIEKRDIKPGRLNLITPRIFHRVDLKDEAAGAWSIFFTGGRTKSWGFLNRHTSEFTDFRKNPEAIP